jgi:hypothetical protein
MAAQAFDRRLVAHAEPEQEAAGERLAHRLPRRVHRHRVACVDARDPGGHDQAGRRAEQERRVHERVAADRLGQPNRAVPQRLDLGDRVPGRGRGLEVELEGPEAHASEVHGRSVRAEQK